MQNSKLNQIIDFLFPKICTYCKVYDEKFICEKCKKSLRKYKPESFISRERSSDWEIEGENKTKTNLKKVYYFYEYCPVIHSLIKAIKYDFQKEKINSILELLLDSKEFTEIDFSLFDIITFIPLSKEREAWRGFNHTQILAGLISIHNQKPYCQLLIKKTHTRSQIDLTKIDREKNLKDVFDIKDNLPIELNDQNILILDDICTTGSTLNESANTIIRKFPNAKVYGLCLARGS